MRGFHRAYPTAPLHKYQYFQRATAAAAPINPTGSRRAYNRGVELHTAPSLPSATRLARLTLWLALTIAWFAAHVLALFAADAAKRPLAKYARWSRCVLVVRAMRRTPGMNVKWRKHTLTRARCLTLRRVGGGALRRAFSGRTPAERARAIYAVLTNPERWIAHLMRRLARRFSKLRALPRAALILGGTPLALSPDPRAPDSS